MVFNMNTLEELKQLKVNEKNLVAYLCGLKTKDDIFAHCFKIIKKNGKAMGFNNFLVASEDKYIDLLENNNISDLPINYVIFANGPDGEEFAVNNNDNSISCFLLNVESDEKQEVKLTNSFKQFIELLERIKPVF